MSSELLLQTLQHLSQAATVVDGDSRTNKLLNCYYLSRIQTLAAAENVSIESPNSSCRKCITSFRDSRNFSLSIKARKVRKAKYKKLATNAECKSNGTKFKKKLGRKYSRLVYNVAEITCKLCHSTSRSSIRFEDKDKSKPKSIEPPIVQLSALELVNPKKRKRDKNAGLILKDTTASGSKNVTAPQPKVIQPIKVPLASPKANKAKKSKNFPAEKKAKNVSAAQKQRKGILLLANVLKMNEQKQQNSGTQSMLSKMFK
ncbi:uncharacterized protein LOC119085166 [Bradysia coprophila]|uniref:uncharacterized protein LOC119085166 n=1 Tax=Bradysia coprophila TaxID=38358 RepID=UPI00187DD1DC|nr:uncharacterized protein LOC119085166 [Bradysia coprophila]